MTEAERALFLKVHAGDPMNLTILYMLDSHKNRKELLEYLIREQLVGFRLTDFVRDKFNLEPLLFLGYLTKKVLNVNTPPKLIIGKNFN